MARRDPKNTSNIHKVSPRTKNVFKGINTNILKNIIILLDGHRLRESSSH
jgi:hypothetical protein